MTYTTELLENESGIQYQGVKDKSGSIGTYPITGLMTGIFKRGRFDKPMTITNENIRAQLGYDPKNSYYVAVQDVLSSGVPSVQVLRLKGDFVISCAGATSTLPFDGFQYIESGQAVVALAMSLNGVEYHGVQSWSEGGLFDIDRATDDLIRINDTGDGGYSEVVAWENRSSETYRVEIALGVGQGSEYSLQQYITKLFNRDDSPIAKNPTMNFRAVSEAEFLELYPNTGYSGLGEYGLLSFCLAQKEIITCTPYGLVLGYSNANIIVTPNTYSMIYKHPSGTRNNVSVTVGAITLAEVFTKLFEKARDDYAFPVVFNSGGVGRFQWIPNESGSFFLNGAHGTDGDGFSAEFEWTGALNSYVRNFMGDAQGVSACGIEAFAGE